MCKDLSELSEVYFDLATAQQKRISAVPSRSIFSEASSNSIHPRIRP